MFNKVTYKDAVNSRIYRNNVSKRIAVMLPAYNEENAIGGTLDSLKKLHVPNGLILDVFIAFDNCTDATEDVVRKHTGDLNVYGLDTVNNKERKVGALNQLYQLFFGDRQEEADELAKEHLKAVNNTVAFLGIDADVYLDRNCLDILYAELNNKFHIGGVSANYISLMPQSDKKIDKNDPERQYKLAKGNYGGPVARFITAQQNKSFTSWTLEQKHNGHQAQILGGQCTLFRPQALKEIYDHFKLNGVYSFETDTEDLLLTQQLRELGWKPVISSQARCYVDSMKTMPSYINQQKKWTTGKLDYTTKAGVSTSYARKNWLDELALAANGISRIGLLVLVPISLAIGQFMWSWIFALPILLSMVLNTLIVWKVPQKRFIDVLMSVTTISSEFAIWFDLYIHFKSWRELAKIERVDGWQQQYAAEQGTLKSSKIGWLSLFAVIVIVAAGLYYKVININSAIDAIRPYVNSSFTILYYLSIFSTLLVVNKIFKIRGNFKA